MQAKITTTTTTNKMTYRIEAKPDGGFIAYPSDPALGVVEGATREEIQQKIEAKVTELLQEQLPHFRFGNIDVKVTRRVNFVSGKTAEEILEKLQQEGDAPLPAPPPIAPAESGNQIWRFALAVIVLQALVYYFSHR